MPGKRQFQIVLVALVFSTLAAVPVLAADVELGEADVTVYSPAFEDVADDHLFAASIRALFAARVTRGCNDTSTRFCPDDEVTRGQMAAFLTRALELPETDGFNFVDDDHSIFEDSIERLAAAGITRGCNPPDNDRFCPDRPVTRAQMAAFLTRAVPLETPPVIPHGVQFEREPAESGVEVGIGLSVCRETEVSLMVRSISDGTAVTAGVTAWQPSTFAVSSGEVDLETDRWLLPAASGCETLDIAWDPRTNVLTPPLATLKVKSPYGYRIHPIYGVRRLHTGTDFDAETGDLIYAAATGVVTRAGTSGGYGLLVEIYHVGGLVTRYAHQSSIGVSVGDVVAGGDVVGRVGCTGTCTGSHLHFETREFDQSVDPMSYLGS